jgi:hypothetical protein
MRVDLGSGPNSDFGSQFAINAQIAHYQGTAAFALMLMVDEADEFVPQRLPHGHEAMFGAFDRLVRRGRSSGIGVTLISQRAQVVNKDVLSQIETLIGMRVLHKLDRKALEAWIEAHDTEGRQEEFLGSLASLGRGDAWIWSPSWLNVFTRVHIRERKTFDSSATPTAGESIAPPKESAPVDLEKLRAQMSAQIAKAQADDPRALRGEIARLQAELKKKGQPAVVAVEIQRVEVPALKAAEMKRLEAAAEKFKAAGQAALEIGQEISSILLTVSDKLERLDNPRLVDSRPQQRNIKASVAPSRPNRDEMRRDGPKPPPRQLSDSSGKLPAGEHKVLTACAQYPDGATREQLTILTGYKRSSRDAYLQRLREKGYVEVGALMVATPEGIAALGPDFQPLPTGRALQKYWLERLPAGEKAILEVLIQYFPHAVDRDELDEPTGYKRSSRDAYIQRLSARQLVVVAGPGAVKASEVLFE